MVEWLSEPLVPVIVSVKCKRLRKPDAVTVNVDVPGLAGFGENDPVEPLAKPVADSATGPAKPFTEPIVTV